jgi:acylphosphatase
MADTTVRRRAVVTGRVQGVWYRAFVADAARAHGVAGFATNERDGSVLIELEGPASAVDAVLARCRTGPPRAHVAHLAVEPLEPTGATGFSVR